MGGNDDSRRRTSGDPEDREGQGEQSLHETGNSPESGDREADEATEAHRPSRARTQPASEARLDADGRERDALGRVVPSRLNWLKLIRGLPSLVAGPNRAFARRVPDSFFTLDAEEDGTQVAVVACPCGQAPRIPFARCVECTCERFYLALRDRVLVANSPESTTSVVD